MTNKFFGTKLLATALATFALASCQSESSLVEPSSNNRRDVELTVTATKGELMTRTDINLSNDEKKLIKTWDLGDRIHVCESNGAYVGYLDVTGLNEDHTQATFKGVVSLLDNDGKQTLSFVTLGKGMDEGYEAKSGKQMTAVEYDFTNQTNPASVASLGDYDLMFTDCEVEVKGGSATFVDLQLKREFAFGRFTLLYNDVPLQFDANTVVTIDTEAGDMKSGASVAFPKTVTPNRTTSLSVTTNENDFYVRMVPGSEQGRIKFNVTVNGEAYEGYSSSFLIEKNDFFRFNEGGPLPINVKRTDGSDDEHKFSLTYNANYGSNDTWTDNKDGIGFSYTYTLSEYGKIFDETNEGYDFVGWNTSADGTGETLNPGSEYTVTYPDGTATLYAQWKKSVFEYTIIFADRDGNEIAKESFKAGSPYTIKVEDYEHQGLPGIPANMELLGWALKEVPNTIVTELTYDTEHTVYTVVPVYKEYTWKFQWVDDPTVGKEVYKTKLESGTTSPHTLGSVHPANPTKDGYTFLGWEYNGKMIASEKEVVATKDNLNPLIYAKWKKDASSGIITAPGAGGSDY